MARKQKFVVVPKEELDPKARTVLLAKVRAEQVHIAKKLGVLEEKAEKLREEYNQLESRKMGIQIGFKYGDFFKFNGFVYQILSSTRYKKVGGAYSKWNPGLIEILQKAEKVVPNEKLSK